MFPRPRRAAVWLAASCLLLMARPAPAADDKPIRDKVKAIAGTAEFLRSVPKHFATLKGMDRARRTVTLLIEGESEPKSWPLAPDAEVKRAGWWARLDQLRVGDRVWAWLQLDRVGQPVAVSMLCDELSQQDIHGSGLTVEKNEGGRLTVKRGKKGPSRAVSTAGAEVFRGKDKAKADGLKAGELVYLQSAGGSARQVLDAAAFEARRAEQRQALRQRWLDEGVPGTVAILHPFGGEMEVTTDHEAMRWARALKPGDKVAIRAAPLIPGVVKAVTPWRERTLLRLVVRGSDQADLAPGQRVQVNLPAPSAEVEASPLPPDLGRPRARDERIEWFLASVYCTCPVGNDTCTGHFYTLASCNPNGCGLPNQMREELGKKIDGGLSDKQIFEELLKDHGPELLRPHLMP